MSILKQLFSWGKHGKENGFHWENTGFGLRFRFPVSWKKERFQEGLATYQYLVLQQLLEAGEAQQGGHDIHVDSDVVCRLDPISRQILGLPDPWPGHFELEVHSVTHRPDFALSLRPLSSRGRRSFAAALEGLDRHALALAPQGGYLAVAVLGLVVEAQALEADGNGEARHALGLPEARALGLA